MNGRPDPITGKVTLGALAGVAAGGGITQIIAALADTPAGTAWVDWLRWTLALAGAVVAVYVQAQRAKRDTTPVDSPMDRAGNQLVPVGRHEAMSDGSGFFDDDPAEEPGV